MIPPIGLAGLALFALAVLPAYAHTRVEAGPYLFIIGWEHEPVIVGERNALFIEISDDQVPVTGAEGSLDLIVFYGGRSYIGQLAPAGEDGVYTAEIFPTVRGQYEVQITGEIEGTSIDLLVEPEEVLPADILQFPEVQPDPGSMQARIETLETDLEGARTQAAMGMALGVLGLLAGAAALWIVYRSKRN